MQTKYADRTRYQVSCRPRLSRPNPVTQSCTSDTLNSPSSLGRRPSRPMGVLSWAGRAAMMVCAVLIAPRALAEIIPMERRISWNPGLPGGIPEAPVTVSVRDHGAAADGSTDDYGAFKAAMDALPATGGVVLIPAGSYFVGSRIEIGRSIVLRGEGLDKTHILVGNVVPAAIEIVTYKRGTWTSVLAGADKGSKRVVVREPSGFAPGAFAEIQQDNDPSLMYTSPTWNQSWAQGAVGQILRIEQVRGDTVVLDRGLYIGYRSALNPQMRTQGFVERAGIERLHIKRTVPSSDGSTIALKNAAWCWVREVESDCTRKSHITCNTVYQCEFRDSWFHHSWDYGGSGHGYGVELGFHCTDCLTENNVFQHLRHAMMVHVGACGNVFGYNFSTEARQGDGTTNLNQGWCPPDISLHGHYAYQNLFEGNVVEEIGISDYWGPVGPGNTFLRNVVAPAPNLRSDGDVDGVTLAIGDKTNDQFLVGNVLVNGSMAVNDDPSRADALDRSTLILHGHAVAGTLTWEASISDRVIPVSYYLTAKPGFLLDKPWPLQGSDHAEAVSLPAQDRFTSGNHVVGIMRRAVPKRYGVLVNVAERTRATGGAVNIAGRRLTVAPRDLPGAGSGQAKVWTNLHAPFVVRHRP